MYVYNSLKVAGVEVLSAYPITDLFEGRQIYIDGVTYVYTSSSSPAPWSPIGGAQTSVDRNTDVVYTSTPATTEAFGYTGTGGQTNTNFENQTDKYGFTIAGPTLAKNIIAITTTLRFNSQNLGDLDGNAFQLELWTASPALLPATFIASSDVIRVYDQNTGSANFDIEFTFQVPITISAALSPNGYCAFVVQKSTVSTNTNLQFQFPIVNSPNSSMVGFYNFIWDYGIGWEIYPAQRYPVVLSFRSQDALGIPPDRFKVLGLGWDGLLDIDFLPPGQVLPPLQAGRYLYTDGADLQWNVVYPDPSLQTGEYLQAQGSGTVWAPVFPNQTGQSGKVLTTDGTQTLWVDAGTGVLPPVVGNAGRFLGTDGLNEFWLPVLPDQSAAVGQYLQAAPGGTQIWASPLPAPGLGGYLYNDGTATNVWQEPFPPYATGSTPGQILSSTGTAGDWIDQYPPGAITGQFLTQSAGGPAWGNIPVQGDLPDPAGQAGKVVGSNGAAAVWQTFVSFMPTYSGTFSKTFLTETAANVLGWVDPFPSQAGQSGRQLTTDGAGNLSWVAPASGLPSQTGNSGKYLQTDGTNASWQSVVSLTTSTINSAPLTRTLPSLNLVYLVDSTVGAFFLTLPAGPNGSIICIKDTGGATATNAMTVQPTSGTIDGAATAVIRAPFESLYLISNGTNWFII